MAINPINKNDTKSTATKRNPNSIDIAIDTTSQTVYNERMETQNISKKTKSHRITSQQKGSCPQSRDRRYFPSPPLSLSLSDDITIMMMNDALS